MLRNLVLAIWAALKGLDVDVAVHEHTTSEPSEPTEGDACHMCGSENARRWVDHCLHCGAYLGEGPRARRYRLTKVAALASGTQPEACFRELNRYASSKGLRPPFPEAEFGVGVLPVDSYDDEVDTD
jgi:hypothetical protein